MGYELAVGIPLGAALLAWRTNTLTRGGALAAFGVGVLVLGSAGWTGAAILASFFVPSTVVGRLTLQSRTPDQAREEVRSAIQVLANGGAAAAGSLAELCRPGLGVWIVTAALAAASSDTWATSLGRLSGPDPRILGWGQRVAKGTSGGVSLSGTLGGLAGAAVVAGAAALMTADPRLLAIGSGIGVAGMFLDSVLGAGIQARFECPRCAVPTEQRRHGCGTLAHLVGGAGWLDNDGVNLAMTTTAALAGALAWMLR